MGFSFPQGLLALGFLAVLVWIYFRERRQRALDVPSLLLWRSVREEKRRNRFVMDPLFVLQAVILAALAIGLARPYLEPEGGLAELRRAVLVFDTSASMQTLEDGESRFDQARRRARDVVASLDAFQEVMVIAVAARPRVAMAFTRDRTAVTRAISELVPTDGPGRLSLGVQLARSAASGGGRVDIVVFTDLPRSEIAAPLAAGERLRYFRFGRTDDNVAIAALRVYQNPFQDVAAARAYALIKNYSTASKEVHLHVRLASRDVLEESITLGPREARAVSIRRLDAPGTLEARLDVADALAVDNRALAVVRDVETIRLLAVSASPDLFQDLRSLAEAVPAFHVREVAPPDLGDADFSAADVVIFHGIVPQRPVRMNALYVFPPVGNPLFTVEGDVAGAQILDWDERHPVLRDLRYVEALPLARARKISPPEWAHALITSRHETGEFPLAFAGEPESGRVVVFAFDLAERSVRKSENLSLLLLLLNTIKWLTPPQAGQALQVDIGESYRETLPAPVPVTIQSPGGSRLDLPARTEIALDLEKAGEHEIRIGDEWRTIYANLFDSEESDIGRKGAGDAEILESGATTSRAATARSPYEYGVWLYVAAILVALTEWVWAIRRRGSADG